MSQVFKDMWTKICSEYKTNIATGKRLWIEFYHPSLKEGFFFTGEPTDIGWSATDVDQVWDTTVNVTPTGENGWATAIEPTEAEE